ncbi:PucR family transcriptional regulator ligand-binding domain-containing protein [Streptomyces sp. NPDC059740]|uniref:PucR family transcriptional regulator ligand-binding domain-containing protein n=1 Tax=Streptomyces sp. NPDC059740 TaxID=3346926 RepID=UPI003660BF08
MLGDRPASRDRTTGPGDPLDDPGVPLADLLAHPGLGLRQVAGPRRDVAVRRVHTSEMSDPEPYLLGGELLLTAGLHLPAPAGREAALHGYVRSTLAAGAAVLGFGVAPVHEEVPPALVEACDRYGLPLLEVPRGTPFVAVESAVWQALTAARHRQLVRLGEAQRALASAAAGADPVTAVLRALARHLGGWAALCEAGGREIAGAGTPPGPRVREGLRRLRDVVATGGPASAGDTSDGAQLAAYAVGGQARAVLLIAAADPHRHAPTVAGLASVLLSLLVRRPAARVEPAHAAALVRLLLGAAPDEAVEPLGGRRWRVVRARGRGDREGGPAEFGEVLGSALVEELAAGAPSDATVRAILPAGVPVAQVPGWVLGVSEAVPAAGLATADRDADRALRRAVATARPLVRTRPVPPGGVGALVPPEAARERAAAQLAPLAGRPELAPTLRVWLSLHGSWDRTATALGVHRNTVRQRLSRIATLLDADVDDPDVRTELWLALRHAEG